MHYIALDGLCEYELRENFGISEISLPNVAGYFPGKKKGTRIVGKFKADDIGSFVEGLLRSKLETFDIKKLEFIDRDCNSIEQSEESNEDDEILNEILKAAEDDEQGDAGYQKKSDTKRGRKRKNKVKSDL